MRRLSFHTVHRLTLQLVGCVGLSCRSLQTHYVISDGQTELETKQPVQPQNAAQAPSEQLEQQTPSQPTTTQYIITTTTNGSGASDVHVSKP